MQLVRSFNVPFALIYRLIGPQGNAFVLAIEPILCCRLVLNTRLTLKTSLMGTELTTTGVAALDTELKAYRDYRSLTRRHLDSMGLPQIAGTSTSNPMVIPYCCAALIVRPRIRCRPPCLLRRD